MAERFIHFAVHILVFFILLNGCLAKITKARAYIYRAQNSIEENGGINFSGIVDFQEIDKDLVLVNGMLNQVMPKGKHGFHVHAFGDIDANCLNAGSHFNPDNNTHGAPNTKNHHVGDLGNIESDDLGKTKFQFNDSTITLNGPNSIVGRSVVIHENIDDLGQGGAKDSLTTGNAGKRILCGIIGLVNETQDTENAHNNASLERAAFLLVFILAIIM